MSIELPKQMTSAWLSTLSDNDLYELEKQMAAKIPREELNYEQMAKYNTLLSRHDRICEEIVRRGYKDPVDHELIPLRADLPQEFSNSFLASLSNPELIQLKTEIVQAKRQAKSRLDWLNRKRRQLPDHETLVDTAANEVYRLTHILQMINNEETARPRRELLERNRRIIRENILRQRAGGAKETINREITDIVEEESQRARSQSNKCPSLDYYDSSFFYDPKNHEM